MILLRKCYLCSWFTVHRTPGNPVTVRTLTVAAVNVNCFTVAGWLAAWLPAKSREDTI